MIGPRASYYEIEANGIDSESATSIMGRGVTIYLAWGRRLGDTMLLRWA